MGFSDRIVCIIKDSNDADVEFELRDIKSKKQLRTIKCDGPDCTRNVEVDIADVKAIQEIDWLPDVRMVITGDERKFAYCSDACEVRAVTREFHNLPKKIEPVTPPTIIPSATDTDVKVAAAQVAAEAQTTEALKTGGEAQIYTTD